MNTDKMRRTIDRSVAARMRRQWAAVAPEHSAIHKLPVSICPLCRCASAVDRIKREAEAGGRSS